MKGGWKIVSIKETDKTVDFYLQLNVALLNSSSDRTINMRLFGLAMESGLKICYEVSYSDIFMKCQNKTKGILIVITI